MPKSGQWVTSRHEVDYPRRLASSTSQSASTSINAATCIEGSTVCGVRVDERMDKRRKRGTA